VAPPGSVATTVTVSSRPALAATPETAKVPSAAEVADTDGWPRMFTVAPPKGVPLGRITVPVTTVALGPGELNGKAAGGRGAARPALARAAACPAPAPPPVGVASSSAPPARAPAAPGPAGACGLCRAGAPGCGPAGGLPGGVLDCFPALGGRPAGPILL
jgi:hypothetical protein